MLYEFVRGLDLQGRGCAHFNLDAIAATLHRSPSTIKRWLKWGKELGLFRHYESRQRQYTVYYTSLAKVCLEWGLPSWGTVAEVPVEELVHQKAIAAEAEMQRLQRASRYRAKQESRKNVLRIRQVLPSSQMSQRGALGQVLHQGSRLTFIDRHAVPFGVSQETIATQLGRSERTIQRRLGNKWRGDRGLAPIIKRQIAQEADPQNVASYLSGFRLGRWLSVKRKLFVLRCNVYAERLDLRTQKVARKYFKKLVGDNMPDTIAPAL